MIETSQTIPELVSWAKEREFSLNLPTERLVFLLAIAIYNNERLDGEMLEADLVDIFRHTTSAFDQSTDAIATRANNAINELVKQRFLNQYQFITRLLHFHLFFIDFTKLPNSSFYTIAVSKKHSFKARK